jgi:hypothetical protein
VVNGQGELVDLKIAAAAIDPADLQESAQTIADLVLAACRDAYGAAEELQQQMMAPLAGFGTGPQSPGGGGLPGLPAIPGMPALPGLFGGPGGPDDDYDDDEEDEDQASAPDDDEDEAPGPGPGQPGRT